MAKQDIWNIAEMLRNSALCELCEHMDRISSSKVIQHFRTIAILGCCCLSGSLSVKLP